jgi:RimJ/RimL family protein N-acetyltransferase
MSRLFELQPTLKGTLLELRPLAAGDFEALYAAASDPLIWELHPESDRWKRAVFEKFFAGAVASGGAFAITDPLSGAIVGSSRYYDLDEAKGQVAIGFTFLTCKYWGGAHNADIKRALLNHAFRFVSAVIFHVGENNTRSRRAMEKIGGVLCGREEKPAPGGGTRINVVYRIEKKG